MFTPSVDGMVSGYFEWMGAASYTSDQRTSAMHGKQFLLDAVYAGLDAESFSGRLDFHDGMPEGLYQIVVNIEVTSDAQGSELCRHFLSPGCRGPGFEPVVVGSDAMATNAMCSPATGRTTETPAAMASRSQSPISLRCAYRSRSWELKPVAAFVCVLRYGATICPPTRCLSKVGLTSTRSQEEEIESTLFTYSPD